MGKTVLVQHDYPVSREKLWQLVIDYGALQQVMEKTVTFTGLPDGIAATGQSFEVQVSLFGKLPPQPYFMEILECDHDAFVMRSSERGAGVNSWHHTLTITETPQGARLTDRIEIDAGWLTRPFCIWAKYLYKARHKPRLRLLGLV